MSSFPVSRSLIFLFLLVLLVETRRTRRTKATCHDGQCLADVTVGTVSTAPRMTAGPVDKPPGNGTSHTGTGHVLSSLGLTAAMGVLIVIIIVFFAVYYSWLA